MMLRKSLAAAVVWSLAMNSFSAEARSRDKKSGKDKFQPNYERYVADEEYRSGRSSRLTGILLSSIGGGIGGGLLIGGILWNTCIGASDEDASKCKRNARGAMLSGVILTGVSLGAGIPLITVGREKMDNARRRIDQQFPLKDTDQGSEADDEKEEEAGQTRSPAGGITLAVRVLNLEF